MNEREDESMQALLKQALSPLTNPEPQRNLWPAMQRRINARPTAPPWFDWALAGGVAAFALAFPAAIPVFFYYL